MEWLEHKTTSSLHLLLLVTAHPTSASYNLLHFYIFITHSLHRHSLLTSIHHLSFISYQSSFLLFSFSIIRVVRLFCILGVLSGLLAASFELLRDVVTKAFVAIPRNMRPLVGTHFEQSFPFHSPIFSADNLNLNNFSTLSHLPARLKKVYSQYRPSFPAQV